MRRWSLTGDPRGLAVTSDGTVYIGLARSQSVVAFDPKKGTVLREVILDSADIASTKELVTLRLNADQSRLVVANGSDESVTILALPELRIVREIGLEGEAIRDALPDPKGRYLYVLGRGVHVFDPAGETEVRTLRDIDATAIATNSTGSVLAVVGTESFASGPATVAVFYDSDTLKEIDRQPLQTDRTVQTAMFAADDRALVVLARDWFGEKPLEKRPPKVIGTDPANMRMSIGFGDLINSQSICLPQKAGPQIGLVAPGGRLVVFGESPCASGTSFSASRRLVTPASIYGISAWALAMDPGSESIWATDPAGFLTEYKVPKPENK